MNQNRVVMMMTVAVVVMCVCVYGCVSVMKGKETMNLKEWERGHRRA